MSTGRVTWHLAGATSRRAGSNSQIEKIFEPFYTTREKGTGLGLAIVHKIVENHSGELRVISPLQGMARGCCFSIILPIITAKKTEEVKPVAETSKPKE